MIDSHHRPFRSADKEPECMPRFGCGARGRQVCRRRGAIHGCAFGANRPSTEIGFVLPIQSSASHNARAYGHKPQLHADATDGDTRRVTECGTHCDTGCNTEADTGSDKRQGTEPGAGNDPSKFRGIGGAAVRSLQRQQSAEDVTIQAAGNNPTNRRYVVSRGQVCFDRPYAAHGRERPDRRRGTKREWK